LSPGNAAHEVAGITNIIAMLATARSRPPRIGFTAQV
jgi:hypothetical protein